MVQYKQQKEESSRIPRTHTNHFYLFLQKCRPVFNAAMMELQVGSPICPWPLFSSFTAISLLFSASLLPGEALTRMSQLERTPQQME